MAVHKGLDKEFMMAVHKEFMMDVHEMTLRAALESHLRSGESFLSVFNFVLG